MRQLVLVGLMTHFVRARLIEARFRIYLMLGKEERLMIESLGLAVLATVAKIKELSSSKVRQARMLL